MAPVGRASCEKHLLRLAARQHGVVTRRQVLETGLTKSALESRVRKGVLERMHPGVYCVAGCPRTVEQRSFAAAAWGGDGAVVSHVSAAHLWQMIEAPPVVSDISAPRKRTRPPAGVRAHLASDLRPRDCGRLYNIPITSPVRTLIDVAGALPQAAVEQALHRAIVDRRVGARALWSRLADAPAKGSRGPALLRRLLRSSDRRVASPLERLVAGVLRGPGLPPFVIEHPVYVDGGVYYLDFAFPHYRVGVEADSRRWHSEAASFESDRVRHNALTAGGWRVLRVTERQVRSDPGAVRDGVRRMLIRA